MRLIIHYVGPTMKMLAKDTSVLSESSEIAGLLKLINVELISQMCHLWDMQRLESVNMT